MTLAPKAPDFDLWITDKENTANRTLAGAVWFREVVGKFGTFNQGTLKLNPGVVIDGRVADSCFLTLKPAMTKEMKRAHKVNVEEPEPLDPEKLIK